MLIKKPNLMLPLWPQGLTKQPHLMLLIMQCPQRLIKQLHLMLQKVGRPHVPIKQPHLMLLMMQWPHEAKKVARPQGIVRKPNLILPLLELAYCIMAFIPWPIEISSIVNNGIISNGTFALTDYEIQHCLNYFSFMSNGSFTLNRRDLQHCLNWNYSIWLLHLEQTWSPALSEQQHVTYNFHEKKCFAVIARWVQK